MRSIALFAATAVSFALAGASGFSQTQPDAPEPETGPALAVGDILHKDDVHIISEPGRYGLGRRVADSEYALANGWLIRIDPANMKVLSILRIQNTTLD